MGPFLETTCTCIIVVLIIITTIVLVIGAATVDQIGVAFGYVAHLVYLLSEFLLIPLHYPIVPLRPKATIIDNIHVGIDIKE